MVFLLIYLIIGIPVSIGLIAVAVWQDWGEFYYPDSPTVIGGVILASIFAWPITVCALFCTLIGKLTIHIVERFK